MICEQEFKSQARKEDALIAFFVSSERRLIIQLLSIFTFHSIISGFTGMISPTSSILGLLLLNAILGYLIFWSRQFNNRAINRALERREDSLIQADLASKHNL